MTELPAELLQQIERPDVEVLINGVPAETWVVLLPSPGGARMMGSSDIHPAHMPATLRSIANVIEADAGTCGCGEHG